MKMIKSLHDNYEKFHLNLIGTKLNEQTFVCICVKLLKMEDIKDLDLVVKFDKEY